MLTIRPDQMAELRRAKEEAFKAHLLEQLAAEYPEPYAAKGEPAVKELILDALATGEKHGIENQGDLATLAELMFRFGRRFELSPDRAWAHKVLAKPDLPGAAKMAFLWKRMEETTDGRLIVPVKRKET